MADQRSLAEMNYVHSTVNGVHLSRSAFNKEMEPRRQAASAQAGHASFRRLPLPTGDRPRCVHPTPAGSCLDTPSLSRYSPPSRSNSSTASITAVRPPTLEMASARQEAERAGGLVRAGCHAQGFHDCSGELIPNCWCWTKWCTDAVEMAEGFGVRAEHGGLAVGEAVLLAERPD